MIRELTLGITAVVLCSSCSSNPTIPIAQAQSPPIVPPSPALVTDADGSRRFIISLALSSLADLKVREKDSVQVGQMLSDRALERQRLEAQLQQLQMQITKLKQPVAGPPPVRSIPEVANLPSPSFLENVADIEGQKLKIEKADQERLNQQRKLDQLEAIPAAELPPAVLPHERERLKQRQQDYAQAQGELDLARARLSKAQDDRRYTEYLHSLEVSKRAIALQQAELQRQEQQQRMQDQERDRAFKLAQLMAQLQTLETQLTALSAVRSPYAGKVQRIKWNGQNNQTLNVELTLLVNGRGNPATSPSAAPRAGESRPSAGGRPGGHPEP
jgi:hypothetical protein